MCYTWEILRISCTQAFHVTYCYYYFIVLPRPYSPPQSDGEFFASHFIKTPSAESYTFLLTWLLFTCTLFTSMQKPFAGYQQSLSSGPTKFKHFSANASSSCYMQYRILLHFLFEITYWIPNYTIWDSKVPSCLNLFHLIPGVLTHVLCHSLQLWAKNPIFLLLHF